MRVRCLQGPASAQSLRLTRAILQVIALASAKFHDRDKSHWRVLVFATPDGTKFLDLPALERLTGEPVRTDYRMPGDSKSPPQADALLACPLSFNSVNKFAHGHADNLVIGLLCELTGSGVPVVVVPHCKPQLAVHHAFPASIATLHDMGVKVLFNPDAPYERRLPSWRDVLAALPVPTSAR